jgi:hypothetical protein
MNHVVKNLNDVVFMVKTSDNVLLDDLLKKQKKFSCAEKYFVKKSQLDDKMVLAERGRINRMKKATEGKFDGLKRNMG